MLFYINAPKKYRSSKWNYMNVNILGEDGKDFLVINKKGKKLRFNKEWVKPRFKSE